MCCSDAAAFLGPAGKQELQSLGDDAVGTIREESGLKGKAWSGYFNSLDREGGPTAYIFRCRHCRKFGGYSDCH